MIKRARSSAVVALLVIVAGSAIAACGSSNSSSPSASSSSGAATSTSTTRTSTIPGRSGGFFSSLTATQRSCLTSKGVTLPTGGGRLGGRPGGSRTGTFTRPAGGFPGGTSTTGGGFPTGGPGGAGGAPGGGGFRGAGGANGAKFAAAFKACGVTFGARGFGGGVAGARGHVSATALKTFVACVNQHGYKLTDVNTSGQGAALPKRLETNPKFLAAAKDCEQDLRAGAPGGTSTTSSS